MTSPRSGSAALLALVLAGSSGLAADARYQRPGGGFGRVAGRPDRADLELAAARGTASNRAMPDDGVGLRPYERRPETAVAPPPRRTTAQYYPAMRSGRYTAHAPTTGHHCTPSRAFLMGGR